jgi:tetratricopeptide (TPR) repeat protein
LEWIDALHDQDELWRKMKENRAANNFDVYYLLARRAEGLIESCLDHYGLCSELGASYALRSCDSASCHAGRQVAAIRAHRFHNLAAAAAARSVGDVRVVPQGWEGQGNGYLDKRAAQLWSLREAAQALLQLDWQSDSWKWQWICNALEPVTRATTTYDVAHLQLGEAYFNLNDLDRAEATWRQARQLPNASPDLDGRLRSLRFKRAQKVAESGNWPEVVSILDGQIDLSATEMVLLGDAFRGLGLLERARGSWEYALSCDPNAPGASDRLRDLKAA